MPTTATTVLETTSLMALRRKDRAIRFHLMDTPSSTVCRQYRDQHLYDAMVNENEHVTAPTPKTTCGVCARMST